MNQRRAVLIGVAAVVAILVALVPRSTWAAEPPAPAPPKPSPITKVAVQANNAFACDALRILSKDAPTTNVFISPWSISSALAMTMEGARGRTALEMGLALRLPKGLRTGGDRPWKLDAHHAGFAEVQRRTLAPPDAQKSRAIHDQIVAKRQELDGLNKQLEAERDRPSQAVRSAAEALAADINKLQLQVNLFDLRIANAIWIEQTYPFDPAFAAVVGKHYGRGLLRNADFINQFPDERIKINRWVETRTEDRIKDLIPELPPDQARLVRMILVNAIYFKGQWKDPFDKRLTKQGPFSLAGGGDVDAALMQRTFRARYAAFDGAGHYFDTPHTRSDPFDAPSTQSRGSAPLYPNQDGFLIAELPYKGDKLALVVIAPQNPMGLDAVQAKLTGETLAAWLAKLENRDVGVTLPRFKLETSYELSEMLKAAGMKLAFDERNADFTGMTTSRHPEHKLSISKVLHKAFVEVNEEGTEAAAATAVMMHVMASSSISWSFTPVFRADRPFLFLIRDIHTGAVLFLGRMMTPKT
ncbi:MAG TPA: serpin family protein [Polyangia bacterium]|jgi:serine protease inhibitor|nr:serpin family protein [Polyangia bacterium]